MAKKQSKVIEKIFDAMADFGGGSRGIAVNDALAESITGLLYVYELKDYARNFVTLLDYLDSAKEWIYWLDGTEIFWFYDKGEEALIDEVLDAAAKVLLTSEYVKFEGLLQLS